MTALPPGISRTGQSAGTTSRLLHALRIDRQGPVLSIELNTPDQGNVLNEPVLDELLAVLEEQHPDTRVVVLSGAGPDFCLGGDRAEFAEHLAQEPTGGGIRVAGTKARRVCELLTNNPAVTIARVQGKAIGAGLGLALACDLRAGADTATFRLPELALGLPTAWGGLLPRLLGEIGAARVRELVLTCRTFTAQEALSLSVLQTVVPERDLDAAVTAWAKPILRRDPAALRVTKLLLNSHASATHLADVSMFDAELMASVLANAEQARSHTPRRTRRLLWQTRE